MSVTFDDKLNWRSHTEKVTKRAARHSYPLKLMQEFKCMTKQQLIEVYYSYFEASGIQLSSFLWHHQDICCHSGTNSPALPPNHLTSDC